MQAKEATIPDREAKRTCLAAVFQEMVTTSRESFASRGRAREAIPAAVTPQTSQARCPDRSRSRLDRSSGRKRIKAAFPEEG